jgi:hypothetical protein
MTVSENGEPVWRVRVVPKGEKRWDCILMTRDELGEWGGADYWSERLGLHPDDVYDFAFSVNGARKKADKIISRLHKA